ncbi:MAG: 16S rRNA (cytosine(1402)-N(4))-methyltransferase RsmH [Actinomycetaceae bacterium]|nr:16S rRNA (cytosine(1402)-N(4))-methyltransferase RsmH [Actinomycetaceae bacterium]
MAHDAGQADMPVPTSRRHIPVLVNECLEMLAPAVGGSGAILIDATLGMGGHSEAALSRFPDLHVVGIDRDPQAIALASERLSPFGERFRAVHTTYDHIDQVAEEASASGLVDGILMDLGVSSLQLDEADRGFAYSKDAPLDMRMDPTTGPSAADLLRDLDASEIARILRVYGEERFASRIAERIIRTREVTPVTRSGQLVDIVREALPMAAKRTGGNPAKRTFQALRIAVNSELDILQRAIPAALRSLRVGGRIVVESYHSLEDRIVKDYFREGASDHAPPGLPVIPQEMQASLALLTRKAGKADEAEVAANPRSASVRLRGVEILHPWKERV